ncbi:MAG: nitrilase-related carbon-nitrogen hydrolase [Caldimonas sp.]
MTTPKPGLRVAVAQQAMSWTTAENTACIVVSLAVAAEQGAQVCAFSELALTGFHRGIREQALPDVVAPALLQVRAACRANAIACALGTPTFADDGAILNSYVFIDSSGGIASTVSKNGLTPAEQTFFKPGAGRPVIGFEGRVCTTVMCREIEDLESIAAQLHSLPVDVIFWPSLVGHPPGTIAEPERAAQDLGYVERTAELARRLNAFVVQSNWPHALNTAESTYQGESKAYAPDGEILLTLPRDEAGVGVFTLGERDYAWTPFAA